MKNITKVAFCFSFLVFITLNIQSQNIVSLPKEKSSEVDNYKELVNQYKLENNNTQVALYLNKIAFIYWENGIPEEATKAFLATVPFYEKTDNISEITNAYYNVAMIYADKDSLNLALKYCNKSLDVSRKKNSKTEILKSLIYVAYIQTELNQAEKAISLLDEAFELAKEANNERLILNSSKLLAKNYEKLANHIKALEFNDIAAVYEKKLANQNNTSELEKKVAQNQAEIVNEKRLRSIQQELNKLQVAKIKRMQDSLGYIVNAKQDSLLYAQREAHQRQVEIDLLSQERELQLVLLRKQEAQLRVQRFVMYTLLFLSLLGIVFGVILFRRYLKKKMVQ